MLNRLPGMMPPLQMMLDDIGCPKPRELARALGVAERDIAQWVKKDEAPRPVMLALFWLTRWGQSSVDCEAVNTARLHVAIAASLKTEVASLNRRLEKLGRIADFGAANDPAPGVALPAAAPALLPAPDAMLIRPRSATAATTGSATTEETQQPCGLQRG